MEKFGMARVESEGGLRSVFGAFVGRSESKLWRFCVSAAMAVSKYGIKAYVRMGSGTEETVS